MAHLQKSNKCDICQNGSRDYRIHDKTKIAWTHDNEEVIAQINRGLKIARSGVGTASNLAIAGTVSGRLCYKGKIGTKTGGALLGVGAGLAVVDGIMGIIDAATTEMPKAQCEKCKKTLNTPGCMAFCAECGFERGRCKNNDWRQADGEFCCYEICKNCHSNLK